MPVYGKSVHDVCARVLRLLVCALGKRVCVCVRVRVPPQEGTSPSTPHFISTCALLCGPATRCLVCFELRSSEVQRVFLEEAAKAFSKVRWARCSCLCVGVCGCMCSKGGCAR